MSTPGLVTGFVLAGGQSSRMGRDKALLEWHGKTLLDHMTDLLQGVCKNVHVVGRDELPDLVPHLGPLGGVATALKHSKTRHNIITAVDLPYLTFDFLNEFKNHTVSSERLLTVCKVESEFPLCLGIRDDLKPILDRYLAAGRRSVAGLIKEIECNVLTGVDSQLFINLNTPQEYDDASL